MPLLTSLRRALLRRRQTRHEAAVLRNSENARAIELELTDIRRLATERAADEVVLNRPVRRAWPRLRAVR